MRKKLTPPTITLPPIRKEPTLEDLERRWQEVLDGWQFTIISTQMRLDEWRKKHEADPTYAFEWAQSAMDDAARNKIAQRIHHALTVRRGAYDVRCRTVAEWIKGEVMLAARNSSVSTSPSHNAMAGSTRWAMIDAAEELERTAERLASLAASLITDL